MFPSCPCIHRPLQYPHGDTAVWHMACEPALRLGTGVVFACGAPEDGGLVLFCGGVVEMGIQKAPSRFDLTLLCDSFSCTICLLWVEIVLVHC